MTKRLNRSFLILLIFWLLGLFAIVNDGDAQQRKNFLWSVQSSTTTVYVLGSIHFLKPEDYPLNPAIEKAFDRSKILAVEANVNNPGKLNLNSLLSLALYPEGDRLDKHISPQTYQSLEGAVEKLGMPMELTSQQKPWFLALTLEALGLAQLGYDPQYGIDLYFLSKAQGKKNIVEIESVDEQINLLSGFSDSYQELLLLYVLKDLNVLGRAMNDVVKAWSTGDAKGIESVNNQDVAQNPRLTPIITKLIYDRNRTMVSKIEGYLKSRETYFIVVGAGHLVGDKGIINMLKEKGYRVQQL